MRMSVLDLVEVGPVDVREKKEQQKHKLLSWRVRRLSFPYSDHDGKSRSSGCPPSPLPHVRTSGHGGTRSRGEGFVLCFGRRGPMEFSILLHFFECPEEIFRLVRMDRDSTIYGLELERCASLAYVGADVIANLTLKRDWEADGDTAVYGLRHQVGGIILRSLHRNSPIRRFRKEPASPPLRSVELYMQAAIYGSGVDLSAEGVEGETAPLEPYPDVLPQSLQCPRSLPTH
jgi:hypothetical protein